MKLATKLILDGLVRALRWDVHDLAEAVEAHYVSDTREFVGEKPARQAPRLTKEQANDRAGR
jgi:hypothetical protein